MTLNDIEGRRHRRYIQFYALYKGREYVRTSFAIIKMKKVLRNELFEDDKFSSDKSYERLKDNLSGNEVFRNCNGLNDDLNDDFESKSRNYSKYNEENIDNGGKRGIGFNVRSKFIKGYDIEEMRKYILGVNGSLSAVEGVPAMELNNFINMIKKG